MHNDPSPLKHDLNRQPHQVWVAVSLPYNILVVVVDLRAFNMVSFLFNHLLPPTLWYSEFLRWMFRMCEGVE
jgi:hypothetical protein